MVEGCLVSLPIIYITRSEVVFLANEPIFYIAYT